MDEDSAAKEKILVADRLKKWENGGLAPLTLLQRDSLLELTAVASNRPMPKEVPLEEIVTVTKKVAVDNTLAAGSIEDVISQGFAKLGMSREKIETAQQFYAWFSKVEEQMTNMEAEDYMNHVENLKQYQSHCQHIINDVNNALEALDKLEKEYVFVSNKTNALHNACEHLLADQTALINTADAIQENLQYFIEHDRISKKLSLSNLQVTGEGFQGTLRKIDDCMEFMKAHPSYKDSSVYMAKYKQSLAVALGMIKTFVVNSLQSTTQSILKKKTESDLEKIKAEKDPSKDDIFTSYYGKFRTNAPKIKALMSQIEERAEKHEEYQHLLIDIHYCYVTQREVLINPKVTSMMSKLLTDNTKDHCTLIRKGCSYMVHLCEDEHQLFGHFFGAHSPKLYEMLLRLCGSLYDVFRPRLIHINHLETLTEVCSILKNEIDEHVQNNPDQLRAFHAVAHQLLEDVQERLVYRVNIYIRDDIRGFKPASVDVFYPEKLEMMEVIARDVKKNNPENEGVFTEIQFKDSEAPSNADAFSGSFQKAQSPNKFQSSPADLHGMWFPTVRRALHCLSKLYRCVDRTIFQGLSQEILEACIYSLLQASNTIKATTKANTNEKKIVDGQLFMIKHLLILREQLVPFHADFAIKETSLDFTSTKDAAYRLMGQPLSIPNMFRANSNNSIFQFLYEGAPVVKEYYIDSKKEVDRHLKLICEEFINHQTTTLVGRLAEFLLKANDFLKINSENRGAKLPLRQQEYATPELLKNMVSEVHKELRSRLKNTIKNMALYLSNKEIETVLIKPIKLNVQQSFQQLHLILLENYTEDERAMVNAPDVASLFLDLR